MREITRLERTQSFILGIDMTVFGCGLLILAIYLGQLGHSIWSGLAVMLGIGELWAGGLTLAYAADTSVWRKRDEESLPTIDEFIGSDPDFTGGKSTKDYIDDMRGE
jgi:hypothetical protein